MTELREQHSTWCRHFQQAIQADAWGQVLEAVESYERLVEAMTIALPRCHELTAHQKCVVEKTASSIQMRAKSLSSIDGQRDSPTKDDMERVLDALRCVLTVEHPEFPIPFADRDPPPTQAIVQVMETDDNDLLVGYAECSSAKPRPNRTAGNSYFDIRVLRVGLKDAEAYVNPTIVVSVYNRDGTRMEEPKETRVGRCDEPQHIGFQNSTIQLDSTVQQLEHCGAAIFFEVFHYKTKKHKKSCRCWSLVELDEIATNPKEPLMLALELYKKPMDPKRKRIHLFTVKDLFLHIEIQTYIAQ